MLSIELERKELSRLPNTLGSKISTGHPYILVSPHIVVRLSSQSEALTETAPLSLHLPQFAYAAPQPHAMQPEGSSTEGKSANSGGGFAFSAFFQSSAFQSSQTTRSPGLSALQGTPAGAVNKSAIRELPAANFVGFSWGPAKDAFDDVDNYPPPSPSDAGTPAPIARTFSAPPSFLQPQASSGPSLGDHSGRMQYATPVRAMSSPPQTLLRTGTVRRTSARRPISDREAMKQLVDCIGLSARKRVLESGKKPRVLQAKPSFGTLKRAIRFAQVSMVSDTSLSSAAGLSGRWESVSGLPAPVFEGSETESEDLPPSPSPSPRPGSAMSMTMTRSRTPTFSGTHSATFSGKLTLSTALPGSSQVSLPLLAVAQSRGRAPSPSSLASLSPASPPTPPLLPSSPISESYSMGSIDVSEPSMVPSSQSLEARHRFLMKDIETMEVRLRRLRKLSQDG